MVKSMRGKEIDMGAMVSKNATARAVGNASMNARGDRIDTQGNILMTREAIDAGYEAYYRENPQAVRNATLAALEAEASSPADALKAARQPAVATADVITMPAIPAPASPDAPAPVAPKTKKVLSPG